MSTRRADRRGVVSWEGSHIRVTGDIGLLEFRKILSALHVQRMQSTMAVQLDFSDCSRMVPAAMLAVCAQVLVHREKGAQFRLIEPADPDLRHLFHNANWAHLLDPSFGPSKLRSRIRLPATRFSTAAEQQDAVNSMVEAVLGCLDGFERSALGSLEWSLAEITDNVLTHAGSEVGGIVQVSFQRKSRRVEYLVADAGLGIPKTLRQRAPAQVAPDLQLLREAIERGVTRDPKIGQGNGLYGSARVADLSGGYFHIHSGYARLDLDGTKGHQILTYAEDIPNDGTLISAAVNLAEPELLSRIFSKPGRQHVSYDHIEATYETGADEIRLRLIDEADSRSTRRGADLLRRKLLNLARLSSMPQIVVDFEGLSLVSSSFADEVFAKLAVEYGSELFLKRFRLINMNDQTKNILVAALSQRLGG